METWFPEMQAKSLPDVPLVRRGSMKLMECMGNHRTSGNKVKLKLYYDVEEALQEELIILPQVEGFSCGAANL